MAGEQTQAFITKERSAGTSDLKIFLKIMDHPTFSPFVKKMNAQGMNNRQIAAGIGLNISNEAVDLPKMQQDSKRAQAKEQGKTKLWESGLLGVSDLGAGVIQGALYAKDAVTGGDSYKKFTNSRKDIEENHSLRRQENNQGFDWARLGGQVAATAPMAALGRGYQGAKVLSGAGAKVAAQNAAVGAGIGASSFAKDADHRMMNTALGGVGGAAGAAIGKKVGDVAVRGYNAATNNLRAGAKEIIEQGEKHGVRTSVGDAGRGAFTKRTETAMESVPVVGMAGFREAQQQEAKFAAGKVVEKLKDKMSDVDYKSLGRIEVAANNGDKNAKRIIGIVNDADADSGKILQAAAEIKNWRGQQLASQMYDRVRQQAGNATVTPTKTIQAIDDVIQSDSKVVPNKELLKEIESIRSNLTNPSINTHFGEMTTARSRLGELVDEWGRQGKSTSALTKIRSAIDEDTSNFALNSGKPSLITEYKRADSFYKDLMKSKDRTLANAMDSSRPDEIFNTFMKVGKGDRAANFYQNLDPKGQAALRYEMANRALDKATNESTGVFSPAKFAQEFERMSEPYGSIFGKADKAQMDGFVKLMRHVERAGQYMENPPTGNRLVGMAIGGTAVANAPLALKAAGASAIAKVLFTTNAGKRILLASKDLPLNSSKFANLIKQIQKLAAITGANISDQ